MKKILIQQLLQILMMILSPDVFKTLIDTILDVVEETVEKSSSPVDNMLVLPICQTIRTTFNVPDNDLPPIDLDPPTITPIQRE